jgi:D-alanyl-D-alanine dipeptidase
VHLLLVLALVDAATVVSELQVELKYSTTDNFMGKDVYGDLTICRLQEDAAKKLARAQELLRKARPDLRLRVYDCARPHSIQIEMWKLVKGTKKQAYVADPKVGSFHSYGCAVDLTIATVDGKPLDMGTPYDHFGPEAHVTGEVALFEAGKLSAEAWANRLLLREAMVRAGMRPLGHEWWHFDCATRKEAKAKYPRIP